MPTLLKISQQRRSTELGFAAVLAFSICGLLLNVAILMAAPIGSIAAF